MKERCNNPKSTSYKRYGGRGIKTNWQDFQSFKKDMYSSYKYHVEVYGEKDTTIDRIENDGDYCKENCRWATYKVNGSNRGNCPKIKIGRTTKGIVDWSEYYGINVKTVYNRYFKLGWDLRLALVTPTKIYNRKPVIQMDLQGNFIKEWEYIRDAARELNLSVGNISSVCHGRLKKTGNYKWEHKTKA